MNKIAFYILGVMSFIYSHACYAVEKFEELPDLPESLAFAIQPVEASSVTRNSMPIQNTTEPSIISVVLSLLFVVVLIYMTGILYSKLNKVNMKTLRKQQGEFAKTQVSVLSTTQLGANKTLHVVELDGKRMLIGASSATIQLIKDLGSVTNDSTNDEFSCIEIPNIKIPHIEIPKIEIPSIDFKKLVTKAHDNNEFKDQDEQDEQAVQEVDFDAQLAKVPLEDLECQDAYKDIFEDSLKTEEANTNLDKTSVDKVEPESDIDYELYKKYLS